MRGLCRVLITFLMFASVLLPSTARSHAPVADCPKLTIECPDEPAEFGKTYNVKVRVTGGNPDQELTYNWSISSGEIVEGQGTPSIKIRLIKDRSPTATVEVNGLPPDCEKVASCTFQVS
jgi:hypothetical protein